MSVIDVSPMAIDNASNRCRGIWHATKLRRAGRDHEDEGIYTWLQRMALEALEKGDKLESGKIRYCNMKFVISCTGKFPLLTAVERVRGS